jgi:phosphosulfolactate synthase
MAFLELVPRSSKPRSSGITHVLDKGMPPTVLRSWLDFTAPFVDFLKLGWGTAYITQGLKAKIGACEAKGVRVSTGGTLLEIAAAQRKVREFTQWTLNLKIDMVEVSNGALGMGSQEKRQLIRELSQHFTVLSEVGSKVESAPVRSSAWIDEIERDLEAGAAWVILEGRELGTAGLYEPNGSLRENLVEAILGRIAPDRLIFEAPRTSQQAWLISRLGSEANLGNVMPDDALSVETLRLGLRADTASQLLDIDVGQQSASMKGMPK